MKQFLLFLVFISSTNLFAARQITVTQLPEPNIPLTEVETNVVFSEVQRKLMSKANFPQLALSCICVDG